VTDLARQLFGDDVPEKRPAIIVDLDETLCLHFDVPVRAGVELLQQVDREKLTVVYVTARTEVSRRGTERFLEEHRLPGWRNLLLSPSVMGSTEHKRRTHEQFAREYRVLASIGDSFEERDAASAAGISFFQVDSAYPERAWAELRAILAAAGLLRSPPTAEGQ
jgi:predicted secreted acid phosphatase